jgi:hypothetical protein
VAELSEIVAISPGGNTKNTLAAKDRGYAICARRRARWSGSAPPAVINARVGEVDRSCHA